MGTRCGALDPGVVLHMMEVRGMSHRELAALLYRDSGLKGMSGLSDDPGELLEHEAQNIRAGDALALYVHRIVREIGGLVAILGGLDMLVFSAGIGEHCAPVRERVCTALAWLGVKVSAANADHQQTISTGDSHIKVLVEPTNEAWVAARGALEVLNLSNDSTTLKRNRLPSECFPQGSACFIRPLDLNQCSSQGASLR